MNSSAKRREMAFLNYLLTLRKNVFYMFSTYPRPVSYTKSSATAWRPYIPSERGIKEFLSKVNYLYEIQRVVQLPVFIVIATMFLSSCKTQNIAGTNTSRSEFKVLLDSRMKEAAGQYKYLSGLLPTDSFPKTYENERLKISGSDWWCSGFYPGALLYIYEHTGDKEILGLSEKALTSLEKEKWNKTTHDLGFMMFCSFGNAYRITGDEHHKEIIQEASNSLITRFDSAIGCIRSWDPAPWNAQWEYPVIIDNMMNLEMLLWSSEMFKDLKYKHVAVTHADTTLKNHFRDDYSSYHVVSYDTITGKVEMKKTDQGYADESAWARGQSWGLYGYTVMYRFTKDPKYLKQAVGIADFIVNHPNLPEDGIPYWDFDSPKIPNEKRDASAGAVIASALLELKNYVKKEKRKHYLHLAETILSTLSGPDYWAGAGTNGGFILKHSVGNMPDGTEVDVPLTYADYYFLEAVHRYITD